MPSVEDQLSTAQFFHSTAAMPIGLTSMHFEFAGSVLRPALSANLLGWQAAMDLLNKPGWCVRDCSYLQLARFRPCSVNQGPSSLSFTLG